LFVSISQVIGCEDRLRNDLYCVEWGVKLYSNQPTHKMCSHPRLHPRLHTFRFHLLFKQLHVIINIAIIVVFVNMEMEVFLICLIESYQACKHWYRRGLQNKHTGSCRNYNFQVLKPQFVALSSPYPLSYRKTYHRSRGIAAKTVPNRCYRGNPAVPITMQLSTS